MAWEATRLSWLPDLSAFTKDDLLPEQEAPDLDDITEEDVEYAINHGGNTSGGADLWKPRELRWLCKVFSRWLAVIFNMAEKGPGMAYGTTVRAERLHFEGGGAEHQGPPEVQSYYSFTLGLEDLVQYEVQALR